MKKMLLLCVVLINSLMYGQLVWEQPNTGVSATISVGEFSVWNMVSPTLNGQEMPVGALIGVFYELDGELYCGGYSTWGVGASFESSGMIAISSQGAKPRGSYAFFPTQRLVAPTRGGARAASSS